MYASILRLDRLGSPELTTRQGTQTPEMCDFHRSDCKSFGGGAQNIKL